MGQGCDWVEILEPRSQERMYVNLASGECGWEPPPGVAVRQSDGSQWWELFDSHNNRFYYYNSASQQTVWHRPQACDIVPLAQLQAMKRSSETGLSGPIKPQRGGGEGRRTPLPNQAYPMPPSHDPDSSGRSTPSKGLCDSLENRKDTPRDTGQRWQPAPGSKAAMLVKVNSIGRNQSVVPASALHLLHHNNLSPGSPAVYQVHSDRPSPASKMTAPVDSKQAIHLKKGDNGNFCLVMPSTGSKVYQTPQRSQAGTPRPSSPQYGATPPIYDEPPMDPPIYDEPPMELEGAHLLNRPFTPSTSLQRVRQPQSHPQTQPQQQPKLLQYPASHLSSKHKRNPSATDYSPAGRECIKHMVNVDPATCKQSPLSQPIQTEQGPAPEHALPASPSPSPAPGAAQPRPKEVSLEKKQSWRLLEASARKNMEARHSRQNSLASQEYPAPAAVTYQDSGYSTGPSPSLRRKNRRRALGGGAGGAGQGRPGSVGSNGELSALNEKLMAEMRAVVSRSNTLRGSKASLDTEMSEGSVPRARSPLNSLKKHGGHSASREDISASNRSLYRAGSGSNHGDVPLSPLVSDGMVRQKRTYEKVDTLEKSITSQNSLSSPEPPVSPSQAGTLESKAQSESSSHGGGNGHGGTRGSPHRVIVTGDRGEGGGGGRGCVGYQYPYTTLCKPPPDANMVDWASKNLNQHTQGLFRRRVSISNMLSWNRGSIKKPMLITSDRTIKKEACEMFKLVQAYMGDRPARLERRHAALLVVTKCWGMQGLRDELYVQLVRQTTDNLSLRSLEAGWELMAISLAFFSPSPKFRRYLEGYIQRHLEPSNDKKIMQNIMEQQDMKNKKNSKSRKKRKQNNEEEEEGDGSSQLCPSIRAPLMMQRSAPRPNAPRLPHQDPPVSDTRPHHTVIPSPATSCTSTVTERVDSLRYIINETIAHGRGLPISTYAKYCYRKLQKVAVTGVKKGLRKPTLEELDQGRKAIVTPSLFGSALEEIMERQSERFPERRLPWVQVQLSQYVLALGGAQTEGIFRVPGDIDEVNALKLQVDQWNIPENLGDPNVPASLLKLWYRELEEPVIPQSFYKQCISNYEDPEAAISVVQSLPELSRLVLCYFIHFLQVFAQPVNVSKTKMDVNNLAMVMAPNCLRCQSDDPRIIFENTRKEMSFLRMLIVHLDTSFVKGII
ncbi:rho GTPase-activating protein 39-like isoform X2 [Salmo trutta]|uniref:rho GTPase-activating protein 39-like isoform X2 n=1 Tax=Salmo trutta TaxID=8032 RepID=UPI001130FBC2|nr:rho GTPase-activating protein 39-like isoform X2 [Salmo trutta]